jgi:hypothetical protein
MNEALNEAVYKRFRFIEWDIILASIHSLFKGSIQRSNASYSSPRHEHGQKHGRLINKASVGRFSLKIGILAILKSPVTLQLFFMPSDYGVVLLW